MSTTTDTTCNGWSNYATWRVNLEIVSDILYGMECESVFADVLTDADTARADLADYLKNYTEELEQFQGNGICTDYALAFLGQVNWWEIAENYLSDNPHLIATN